MSLIGLPQLQDIVARYAVPQPKPVTAAEFAKLDAELIKTRKSLECMLQILVFSTATMKHIMRHMNEIYKECTFMLDQLCRYQDEEKSPQPFKAQLVEYLEDVMEWQRSRYGEYLNPKLPLPRHQYVREARQLEEAVPALVSGMCMYHVDKQLQSLIVVKMTSLLKLGKGNHTQLAYLEDLQEGIRDHCTGLPVNITERVIRTLLEFNFNSPALTDFCWNRMQQTVSEEFAEQEQEELLLAYQRELKRLRYRRKRIALDERQPEIRDSLLELLKMELQERKSKRSAAAAIPASDVLQPLLAEDKVPVALSVDALVYFFRLMVTAGMIQGAAKGKLMSFISRHFQTPGLDGRDISVKSLDNKYRQVVKNTAVAVRALLVRMLNVLDKDFA